MRNCLGIEQASLQRMGEVIIYFSFFFSHWFIIYLFILLYNIVLVVPYINMHLPWVYMCSLSWTPHSHLPPCTIPLGHPSAPAPRILYPASNLDWQFISYMILYMFQCHSPKSFHPLPLPLPQSPKDCSIHLCLFRCLAYRLPFYEVKEGLLWIQLILRAIRFRKGYIRKLKILKLISLKVCVKSPRATVVHWRWVFFPTNFKLLIL